MRGETCESIRKTEPYQGMQANRHQERYEMGQDDIHSATIETSRDWGTDVW